MEDEINKRPNFDETFFDVCHSMAKRSTCARRAVGAVAVLNNRILATGYNGAPSGIDHCTSDTCVRSLKNIPSGERAEMCRGIHAEQNMIIQAAIHGVSLLGCTIYCTTFPCNICMKMIMQLKPEKIKFLHSYNDTLSLDTAIKSGYSFFGLEEDKRGYYMLLRSYPIK